MEKQASTPGPWRVGREAGISQMMPTIFIEREVTFVEGAAPTTYHLAEVCYPTSMPGTVGAEERAANARLMAASPDMLTALKQAEKYLASRVVGTGGEGERVVLPAIRAAIQKAVQGD